MFAVSACSGGGESQYGNVGYIEGFYGGVSSEEPTAALIGRNVLTSGGSAADAAVAMGFALSVTYPQAAGLGGGGVCLVHDAVLGLTEVLDFVPPAASGTGGDRPSAVPTFVRGMAALHARYGRFPWRGVVTPAERLARLGYRVSRAMTYELTRAADALYREPAMSRVFAPSGRLVGEGDKLIQADLAGVLGQIRANGAGAFYQGVLARRIVDGVKNAGGNLTFEELSAYSPTWRLPITILYDNDELSFAPPPAAGGPMEAVMWRMLADDDRYAEADASERPHLLAEVMKRASADRKTWLAPGFNSSMPVEQVTDPDRAAALLATYDPTRPTPGNVLDPKGRQLAEVISGTGFVVVDKDGMGIACNLTLYNPFGTGRIADGTGIILAAAPGLQGRNPLGLGPVMVTNANTFRFKMALAASGGPLAPATTVQVLADTLLAGQTIEQSIEEPRFLAVDVPDAVIVENRNGDALAQSLSAKGHKVSRLDWQGRASAIYCPKGLDGTSTEARTCQAVSDPRGHGLAPYSESGS
ncbi:gamma-glutamyltransferase [Rhodospirillaceae bacterium KN72]|uniref:Gamma-glutamyltransferase n=1 Tax=Pacificispira spongiicola TaxID=2729598 RepID=A0A7Y0HG83_9PROT|nr:gamma-glutamyltransferase [Pacificispira spongiicola]NMM44647.1 gamma-glutamyltransferase [Pacificispira spongiicola]